MARKLTAAQVGVAVESFAITLGAGQVVSVPAGTRLRGDHPIVKQAPAFFLEDGATSDEIGAARTELNRAAEPPAVPSKPGPSIKTPRPLKAKDALICIAAGPSYGQRVPRTDKDAKQHPQSYVPVVPAGLELRDAVVALQDMSMTSENGDRSIVYAGQWISRDDPIVKLNPHVTRPVADEEA